MRGAGLYDAVNASNRLEPRLDCISNNISNIKTNGFKAERLFYYAQQTTSSDGTPAIKYVPIHLTDFSQGALETTSNPLDLAIQGEGFFVVQTKEGEKYTRKGNFTITKDNELVTQSGDYVMGDSGKITISGTKVTVQQDGNITVDGNRVGKLKIVKFADPQKLQCIGDGLFKNTDTASPSAQDNPDIKSGALELSNVQSIKELCEMIDLLRSMESYGKIIQTVSDQDKLSTSRIGKLG